MKQKTKTKKKRIKLVTQFIKLQLAGNVLFWGTYAGYWLLNNILGWQELPSLLIASAVAHVMFFIVDKQWVFADKSGVRKTRAEILRFIAFMGFNFALNIVIIETLSIYGGIKPEIGQFIASAFFTFWSFFGLRFWVFQAPQSRILTIEKEVAPYASRRN